MSRSVAETAGGTADRIGRTLLDVRSGPVLGTPCGVLAPLYRAIDEVRGVTTVAREDSAVGVAAGAALAGEQPVVLMQNSGFGQSVNAFASLVAPYQLDVLTVISMRGVAPDNTEENRRMGTLTPAILAELDGDVRRLDSVRDLDNTVGTWLADSMEPGRPRFLLISPGLFGWCP